MSARCSRFLLSGWASAGEAGTRGRSWDLLNGFPRSQEQYTVPSLLRAVQLWPGGSAQTGESQASNSCCSAGPPRPPSLRSPAVHPQPAQGPLGATPRDFGEGARIAAPSSLSAKSWPGVLPWCWGRGPTRDCGPRGRMCGRTRCSWWPIYSRWLCLWLFWPERLSAGGTRACTPARTQLLFMHSSETDRVIIAQHTRRPPSHRPSSASPFFLHWGRVAGERKPGTKAGWDAGTPSRKIEDSGKHPG